MGFPLRGKIKMSGNPLFKNLDLDVIKGLNHHDLLNRANPDACLAALTK